MELNKTIQDLKMEVETIKKSQRETTITTNTRDYQMVKGKPKNLTNRNQDYSPSSEPHHNTTEKEDSDLKIISHDAGRRF